MSGIALLARGSRQEATECKLVSVDVTVEIFWPGGVKSIRARNALAGDYELRDELNVAYYTACVTVGDATPP